MNANPTIRASSSRAGLAGILLLPLLLFAASRSAAGAGGSVPAAVALAKLVHYYAAPLPQAKLDSLVSTRSWVTHDYPLQRPIPFDIHYDLVEVRDDKLVFYKDLYHQSREPLAQVAQRALAAAGY